MTNPQSPSGHPRRNRHRRGRRGGPKQARALIPGQDATEDQALLEGAPVEGELASEQISEADGEAAHDSVEEGEVRDSTPGQGPGPVQSPAPAGGGNKNHARPSHNKAGLEQRCIRNFPRGVLIRGRDYFRSGYVSDVSQMGSAFSLTVQGKGEKYHVWVDFTQATAAGSLEARCTCPFYAGGALCKHLWAAVIQLERSGLSDKVGGSGPLKIVLEGGKAPLRSKPQEGQQAGGVIQPRAVVPNEKWMDRLDLMQGKFVQASRRLGGNFFAAFVIHAAETNNTGKLVLDFWNRRKGIHGEAGPLRPARAPERDFQHFFADSSDQELVALLARTGNPKTVSSFGSPCTRFTLDLILENQVLSTLTSVGKLFISRSPNGSPDNAERPLRMDRGKAWDLELRIDALGSAYRLEGVLRRDDEVKTINEPVSVLRSGHLLFGDRVSRLAEPKHASWLIHLRGGDFVVPQDQGDLLLKKILTDPNAPKITWPDGMGWKRTTIQPRPKGVFRPLGNDPSTGRMTLTVSFDYSGHEITLADEVDQILDLEHFQVYSRDREFEEATLTQALEILMDPTGTIPMSGLQRAATERGESGWVVYIEGKRVVVADDFAIQVSSSTDWFQVSMEATFGGDKIRQADIIAALEAKSSVVKLKDGSVGILPEEWINRFQTLQGIGKKAEDGTLRFSASQGLLLNAALGDDEEVRGDSGFTTYRERILNYDRVKAAKAPTGFKGKLRTYQKDGLTWLRFLQDFRSGGILADDMGLGKTIQVLAFLLSRKKDTELPSLVVAPKSLVFNWIDEAQKFAPTLKVVQYAGGGRQKVEKEIASADLVVTTYGTLRTDIEKLREIQFDVAVIDEAQFIKNPRSQAAIACKQLKASYRIALTGTPIENSIRDLLSILEFSNPDLLELPNPEDLSKDLQGTLARLLKPFMLRRTKEAVLTELPEMTEQVLFCELNQEEGDYYAAVRERYRQSIEESVKENGLGKSKIHVLEALLRLRQAACHAGLIDEAKLSEQSSKLELLLTRLKELIAEGHKALVFSQFTSLLSIVRSSLEAEGIQYEYLDGQTTDRKTPVERFQNDASKSVFLISLKAGGTGLNLTAADYVFILDPWWNPAVEAQAIARAHRMGQTNRVFTYRMVARGTVEEKILELQRKKKDLADAVIAEDTDFMKKLSKQDLEQLFLE